ncbi:hypothetical protein BDN72DRAFT_736789, partial [Pluteus cervinus]
MKPDVTIYHGHPRVAGCDVFEAEVFVEFKYSQTADPFSDTAEGFIHTTDLGMETLGQITSYATAHQAAQFRTHIFSLLVFKQSARILRWDRSGVVVTERFSLSETNHMYDFIRR